MEKGAISCGALAGTLISPIFLPFQVALSHGPSSQTLILNALAVLGSGHRDAADYKTGEILCK